MADALAYTDTAEDIVHSYRRVHANSEQTHVVVLSAGNDRYAVVAYDLDPVDLQPVAAEAVAFDPTLDGAVERARRWMEAHPRGVAGGGAGAESWGQKLKRALLMAGQKLDEYGNRQMEQMDQQQGGGQ